MRICPSALPGHPPSRYRVFSRAGPRVRPLDGGRGGWLGGLYSPQPPAPTYAPPGVFQANGRKGAKVMMAETCGDSKRACPIPPSSPDRCHNFTPCYQPCKHPRCRQTGQGQMVSAQSTTHPFPHGIPVGLIRHHAPGFPVMWLAPGIFSQCAGRVESPLKLRRDFPRVGRPPGHTFSSHRRR